MAKSLRSKTKRAFRRIKREDPKSDYALKDKIRIQRLNEKLKVLKAVDGSEEDVVDEREESDDIAAEGQGDAMTVDSEIPKGNCDYNLDHIIFYGILGLLDHSSLSYAAGVSSSDFCVLDILGRFSSIC